MFSLVSPMLAIFHAQLMTEDCWEWFYLGISTPEMDLRGTTAVKLPGMKPAYNLISTIIQSAIRFLKCFQARRDNWWGNLVYSHFPQQNLLTLRKNINTCTTLFLKVYLHKKLINMSYYFYHHFHFLVVCSWAFICVEWLTTYISEIKQTSIRIVMISIGKDESQELNAISDLKTQFSPTVFPIIKFWFKYQYILVSSWMYEVGFWRETCAHFHLFEDFYQYRNAAYHSKPLLVIYSSLSSFIYIFIPQLQQ